MGTTTQKQQIVVLLFLGSEAEYCFLPVRPSVCLSVHTISAHARTIRYIYIYMCALYIQTYMYQREHATPLYKQYVPAWTWYI